MCIRDRYTGKLAPQTLQWAFPPAYVPYDYEYIRKEAMCHLNPLNNRVDVSQKMHCGNYAAWVLQKLGIIPPSARLDCVTPLDVLSRVPGMNVYAPLQRIET